MTATDSVAPTLRFGSDGLIPVVVSEARTGQVLMLASMNAEALAATRRTGRVHYWSRSRNVLWRKGETSGHEQIVRAIYVNCERTSLLIEVEQVGAVCHDGYETCFYRRLNDDDTLTIVRERAFDPALVYGDGAGPPASAPDELGRRIELLWGAYAFLKAHDLAAVSNTSRLLRGEAGEVHRRVSDELTELAGVLDGSHRHGDLRADLTLEASQVLYWIIVHAQRHELLREDLHLDAAFRTTDPDLAPAVVAPMLRAEAATWRQPVDDDTDDAARCHAALALVAQAVRTGGVEPAAVVTVDLAELRSRSYLALFFERHDRGEPGSAREGTAH